MRMTRAHFEALARALKEAKPNAAELGWEGVQAWETTVQKIADICAVNNVSFNRAKFMEACKTMADQELFDKVVAHLRAQNAKALDQTDACMYRAPDGKRCAAGCLILDEHYAPDLEGKSAIHDGVWPRLRASGVADSQTALVQALQSVHDHWSVDKWESELARVAEKYHLTPPAAP